MEKAEAFGNPITPHTSRLIGPIANERSTKGFMKAEVRIVTLVTNEKFVVVENLHPEIQVGLKLIMENKCTANMVEQNFTVPNYDGSIVEVSMQILDGLFFPRKMLSSLKRYLVPTPCLENTEKKGKIARSKL